jgi:hypothetical protein
VLAAGNTAVFNPHPAGARVAAYALQLFNRTIEAEIGVSNVITTVAEPTIETAEQIFRHPDVALLCVTGGPAVVKAAAQSGKRVIAGGPGNPLVVGDEDADLDLAARSIIEGAAFDNNLLCIGEKEVFVVESVAGEFIKAMSRAGAVLLDARAIKKLTEAAFTFDGPGKGCGRAHVKRDLLGQDACRLAEAAGVKVPAGTVMLFGETAASHPFVQEEQMMPFLPIVRVPDFEAGVAAAASTATGTRRSCTRTSSTPPPWRALNTTLFAQNAPSTAALGGTAPLLQPYDATPTGEGSRPHLHARAPVRHRRHALHLRPPRCSGAHRRNLTAPEGSTPSGCESLTGQRLDDLAHDRARPSCSRSYGAGHGSTARVVRRHHRARLAWQNVPAHVVGIVDRWRRCPGRDPTHELASSWATSSCRGPCRRCRARRCCWSSRSPRPTWPRETARAAGRRSWWPTSCRRHGQMIGVVEGSEAANPYPAPTPVDAYCALIVNDYTFQPPEATDWPAAEGRG